MGRRGWVLVAVLAAIWPAWALAVGPGATTSPDQMSWFTLFGLVAGPATTYAAAFLNREHWPDYVRFGTFFLFGLVMAGVDAAVTRELDWHNWSRAALIIVWSGVGWYTINKGSIRAFERATS
jgi:peptidoglycan/LPS O-acetylase OafA/YrhL